MVQVDNLAMDNSNLVGLAWDHILDHTMLELDNQVADIHILLVMDVTIQEGVAHTTETILLGTVVSLGAGVNQYQGNKVNKECKLV